MTTKQELLEKHEELIKAVEELKEKIDLMPEEKAKRWRAKYGQEYYYLASFGGICQGREFAIVDDDFHFDTGNYFKTEKEAIAYKENLLTKQKLKDLAFELNGGREVKPGDCRVPVYSISLIYSTKVLDQEGTIGSYRNAGQIYCLDEDFLNKAIELIGAETLKQYILSGV